MAMTAWSANVVTSSWGREFGHGGYAWLSFEFWMRIVGVGHVID
jgi:hypothetical protein